MLRKREETMPDQTEETMTASPQIAPGGWYRSMPLELNRADTDNNLGDREIVYSISSEEPVELWFGKEILLHTEEAVDLSRIRALGALLFNHDPNKIFGPIREAVLIDHRVQARAEFDDDGMGNFGLRKVRSESLRGASVRYDINEMFILDEGETKDFDGGRLVVEGPAGIATRWEHLEHSLTPVPADAQVGVGRGARSLDGVHLIGGTNKKIFDLAKGAPRSLGGDLTEQSGTTQEGTQMPQEELEEQTPTGDEVPEEVTEETAETARTDPPPPAPDMSAYRELLARAELLGHRDVVARAIAEQKPREEIQAALLAAVAPPPAETPTPPAEPDNGGELAATRRTIEEMEPKDLVATMFGAISRG